MLYKVVTVKKTNLGERYFSYAAASWFSKTQYFKTRKTFAPPTFAEIGYGLLVFNSLMSVIDFYQRWQISNHGLSIRLFTCHCGKLLDIDKHPMHSWNTLPVDWEIKYPDRWPIGTVMVESVQLSDDITSDILQLVDCVKPNSHAVEGCK